MFPHPTLVHIFRCSVNHKRHGATLDPTGANLPAQLCPNGQWQYLRNMVITPGAPKPFALDEDALATAIEDHGWFVWDVVITVRALPGRGHPRPSKRQP
jgi:hypothetical protein